MKNLRLFILLFTFCISFTKSISAQTSNDWKVSSLEKEGIDKNAFLSLDSNILDGQYGAIDRFLLIKNGNLVYDKKYENDYRELSRGEKSILGCGWETCEDDSEVNDYNYLHPNIHPYYKGSEAHSLQSVTKSITATLFGVAIQKGEIKNLENNLLSYFKEYDLSKLDERVKSATLYHLLTMQTGIEWHEQDRPIDSTNTTLQLEISDDWVQFTLDQPSDAAPGEKWAYSSGGSHLMSVVLKKETGKYVDEYAKENLFKPLGIEEFHWKKTPKGYPDTEGGLFLKTEDLAKIGQLYLNDGNWNGQQILPKGWAKEAVKKHVKNVNKYEWGYGYQWWRIDRDGLEIWAGLGFGGQYLVIFPQLNCIGVMNSWALFETPKAPMLYDFIGAIIKAHE